MHVDVHAHLFPQSAARAQELGREWFGSTFERAASGAPVALTGGRRFALGSPRHYDPPELRLRAMDELRVDLQVISLLPPLFRYELDRETGIAAARAVNDEIAEMVRGWPERFAGLATLPLQDPAAAVAELERAMATLGLVGAAVGSHVNGENWDAPDLFPVLQAAEQLGALVFLHPHAVRAGGPLARYYLGNLVGNPLETTVAAASLIFGGVLDRLPSLRLCLAHGGGYVGFGAGRLDHGYRVRPEPHAGGAGALPSAYLGRLYFDSLTHSPGALRYLVDLVGADQVVLGSDYPADMGEPDPVGFVESCDGLSDAEREAVLGGNLARLLGLGG